MIYEEGKYVYMACKVRNKYWPRIGKVIDSTRDTVTIQPVSDKENTLVFSAIDKRVSTTYESSMAVCHELNMENKNE